MARLLSTFDAEYYRQPALTCRTRRSAARGARAGAGSHAHARRTDGMESAPVGGASEPLLAPINNNTYEQPGADEQSTTDDEDGYAPPIMSHRAPTPGE